MFFVEGKVIIFCYIIIIIIIIVIIIIVIIIIIEGFGGKRPLGFLLN